MLKASLPFTAAHFGRAIIMPNLLPPVLKVKDAIAYRDRLIAALPQGSTFKPLMTDIDKSIPLDELRRRAREAEHELYNLGITFTVYTDRDVIDRILPFDIIPRVLSAAEWARIESGVKQRVATLNLFLADVYHGQKVLKDGIVPPALVLGARHFRRDSSVFLKNSETAS